MAKNASDVLDAYKAQVREKALEIAAEQGWCREGVNAALRDLDIEPVNNSFRVTGTINFECSVTLGDDCDFGEEEGAIDSLFTSDLELGFNYTDHEVTTESLSLRDLRIAPAE